MAGWQEIEKDAPDLAARVQARFAMGTNKTIATLRKDGSPRISASDLEFTDGEVTLGMMGGSMNLLDERRDPRIAVHSPTVEPPTGGAKGRFAMALMCCQGAHLVPPCAARAAAGPGS